jgi:hypothetical protein
MTYVFVYYQNDSFILELTKVLKITRMQLFYLERRVEFKKISLSEIQTFRV